MAKRKGNRGQNIIDFKEKTKQELKEFLIVIASNGEKVIEII